MTKKTISVGVDIGGSHITCRLFDIEKNAFADDRITRVPVNCHASKEEILDTWAAALAQTAGNFNLNDFQGVGFAMPGPFDYPKGIAWFKGVQKFDALYGANIRSELISRLNLPDDFTIRFQNDAVCFAIGESFQGKAASFNRLLAITLGTGFGTTFIKNHLPVVGKEGVPEDGFLYHVPFGNSIADDYFSTRWFLAEYKKLTGKEISGVKELAAQASDDDVARAIFKTFGLNLGAFLTPWLKTFGAQGLVIGGNISAALSLFEDILKQVLQNEGVQVEILLSTLQESAALIGSSSLCNNAFYKKLILPNQI